MMHHQQKKNQLHNSFNLAKFSILRQSPSMDSITSLEFSVNGKSILTSFGLTILIGIIGALYPIMGALRMQPAQALRYE